MFWSCRDRPEKLLLPTSFYFPPSFLKIAQKYSTCTQVLSFFFFVNTSFRAHINLEQSEHLWTHVRKPDHILLNLRSGEITPTCFFPTSVSTANNSCLAAHNLSKLILEGINFCMESIELLLKGLLVHSHFIEIHQKSGLCPFSSQKELYLKFFS